MPERGNLAVAYSSLVEFETFRKSVGMGLIWRGLESDFQAARQVVLANVSDDNIQVDTPGDSIALETGPTFESADMGQSTYSRALIRGTSQRNLLQAMESRAGGNFATNLMSRLSTRMAIKLDDQVIEQITMAAYGAADGNAFELTDVGKAGANGWGIANEFPFRFLKGGTATEDEDALFNGILAAAQDAELKYRIENLLGGVIIGDGGTSGVAFVAHPALCRQFILWALNKGVLDLEASAARQAAAGSGILSNSAYMGRVSNIEVIATTALSIAPDAEEAFGYFVPIGAALLGGIRPMMWDFAQYGQGNTAGAFVARSTVILPYFVGRYKQEYLGRVKVLAR